MKIVTSNDQKKATKDQVSEFESLIGGNLPSVYKKFLLKNNGGRPEPNIFKTLNKEYETDIQYFYGFRENRTYDDLVHNYETLKERFPVESIPIANDSLGNFILLGIKTDNVYFFDHEIEETFLISKTFKDFTKGIYKLDEEESEMDRAITSQNITYFKNIIENGVSINDIRNDYDQEIPIAAALWNKLKLLKYFLDNGAKHEGVFYSACSNGHIEIAKYLLASSFDVDINERDESSNNSTVLIEVCYGGFLELAKLLIAKGADINATDNHGKNALDKSRWSNNQELVDYLENEVYN